MLLRVQVHQNMLLSAPDMNSKYYSSDLILTNSRFDPEIRLSKEDFAALTDDGAFCNENGEIGINI